MLEKYGTMEWLDNLFKLSDDDPWGLSFRGTEQYRYELIIEIIKKHVLNENKTQNPFKALDIGCATGEFTTRLYELTKNLVAIDISKTAIEKAKAKCDHIDFRVGSLPKSSLEKNAFDLITCLEVLYYMDEDTQRNFLFEMNSLLRIDGIGFLTSVIGGKPYFKSKELVKLLSEHFEIKAVEYYGSRIYSKCEGILFKKYSQLNKFQNFLKLNSEELKKELRNVNNAKARMIENMINFVIKFRVSNSITCVLLKAMKKMIRLALGYKCPAKIFHFASRMLSLEPTHTFVLVAKRPL